jgi:uncharacterized protein (TIGR02246 family)
MWKKLWLPLICLCCCTGLALSIQDGGTPPPAKTASEPTAEEKAVAEIIKVYTDVFNKHDAAALAEYWAPKAVSVNSETGSRLVGRDAIKAGFEALFKTLPDCRLSARITSYRFVKADLLTLEGTSTLTCYREEPLDNTFTVMLVKVGDNKWNIEHATEAPVPTPATPYDGLKDLEWLVGTWNDQTPGVTVESNIHWNEKKTFLLRKYMVQYENEEAETGTQVIGYDSRSKTIRSWTFSSDGSFGEGTWTPSENGWRVKYTHTSTEGELVKGTQVITKLDDNTATVQIVGQEVDGDITPSAAAVKMVKKAAASTEENK